MITKKVYFKNSNGKKLCGILQLPDEKGKFPVVIYVAGFRSNKDVSTTGLNLAEVLPKKGIALLRFDLSGLNESEGDFIDTTVTENVDDLKCAIDFAEKHENLDEIGVVGSSYGGFITVLQAERDDRIKCLVLTLSPSKFPWSNKEQYTKEGLKEWKEKGFIMTYGQSAKKYFKLGYGFYEDGLKHDTYKNADKIKCPVLFIHGTKDEDVDIEQALKLFELLKTQKKFNKFGGEGHKFSGRAQKRKVELIIQWFKKWLCRKIYKQKDS